MGLHAAGETYNKVWKVTLNVWESTSKGRQLTSNKRATVRFEVTAIVARIECAALFRLAALCCLALAGQFAARSAENIEPDNGTDLPPCAVARLIAPEGKPTNLAFSPDGKFVAVSSAAKTVHVFATASAKLHAILEGHEEAVLDVAFSPDSKYLASACTDRVARLFDVQTKKQVRTFEGHGGGVKSLHFSPDGSYLITASEDATLKLWDVETGKALRSFEGHGAHIDRVRYSRDARTLLSEAADGTARLWDAPTGRFVRLLPHRDGEIAALDLAPDGVLGVTTRGDMSWHVFDVATGDDVLVLRGQRGNGSAVCFAPDCRSLYTGARDGSVRRWDLLSGQELHRYADNGPTVTALAVDPSGRRMVTATEDRRILVWDLTKPPPKPKAEIRSKFPELEKELAFAWEKLGADDYTARIDAVHRFMDAGEAGVKVLIEHLPPASNASNANVEKLIEQLNADTYGQREAASTALAKLGIAAWPLLRQALTHASPEVRKRAEEILRDPTPATIREVLAIETLGWLATPAALEHVKKLAAGASEHPFTVAAEAVVGRVAK